MKLEWERRHIGADCGQIHWALLWNRDCIFRGWGMVRIRGEWWCVGDCVLHDLCDGLNCTCCSVPIS